MKRSWNCTPPAFDRALETLRTLGASTEGRTSAGTIRFPDEKGIPGAIGRYLYDGEVLTITFTAADEEAARRIWQHLDRTIGVPVARA